MSHEPLRQISYYYREGNGSGFEVRWPLSADILLPLPFSELDRKNQFYVLFGEWQRREAEALAALSTGRLDDAEEILKECVERAEQLEVNELRARGFDGLMRVALLRGEPDRMQEYRSKAAEARTSFRFR